MGIGTFTNLKQVILVRQDLKLPKGKLAAQASHAAVESVLKSSRVKITAWRVQGQKKIVLKVKNEKELIKFQKKAEESKIKTALICDAGRTCIKPGTVTCLGIGPDFESKIDKITGSLPML